MGTKIQSTIIGVGLNVNQTDFADLPHASSMKLCAGRDFEVNILLKAVLQKLQHAFKTYQTEGRLAQWARYETYLFGKEH